MSVPCGTGAGGGGEESPVGNGRLEALSLSVTNASFSSECTKRLWVKLTATTTNSLSNALENQTDTCLFLKSALFLMSGRERQYESGLKIGLHPLLLPHSGQAEQEMMGSYPTLSLDEREECQSL